MVNFFDAQKCVKSKDRAAHQRQLPWMRCHKGLGFFQYEGSYDMIFAFKIPRCLAEIHHFKRILVYY